MDVYSKSILQLVSDRPDAKHGLEAYLVSVADSQGDKSRPPVLPVRQMSRFGMETRVRHLAKGLGISSVLRSLLPQEILGVHAGAFHRFLQIRHRIAHGDPRPGLEEYTYEDLEKDLDESVLHREELERQFKPAFLFHEAIEVLAESLQDMGGLIKKTALVVEMASTYPAFIDSVLEAILTT